MVERASIVEWLYPGEIDLQHWAANFREMSVPDGFREYNNRLMAFTSAGHLTLTNYRLLFANAAIPNVTHGRFSIFLPTILKVFPALRVATRFGDMFFNTNAGTAIVEAVERAKGNLTAETIAEIQRAVREAPDKAGAGTHAFWKKDIQGVTAEDLESIAQLMSDDATRARAKVFHNAKADDVFGLINAVELLYPEVLPMREV